MYLYNCEGREFHFPTNKPTLLALILPQVSQEVVKCLNDPHEPMRIVRPPFKIVHMLRPFMGQIFLTVIDAHFK